MENTTRLYSEFQARLYTLLNKTGLVAQRFTAMRSLQPIDRPTETWRRPLVNHWQTRQEFTNSYENIAQSQDIYE